jgi:two-component system OmpR family sensor kinase
VTAFVINRSFEPMMRVARELDADGKVEPKELAVTGAPSELHPFLGSINGLLRRTHLMIDRQKRFIADAAHELRTPITALSLQAENLEPIEMPPAARERIDALRRGMTRTKRLLEQLLMLAQQDAEAPPTREEVSLDTIAKQVVADLLPQAALRDIDLGFETAEPILVAADPLSMASAVRNILENAIKFTPDGGTIDISVRGEGDWGLFQVDDTGPGIPSADLDRVFEPFFRGRSAVEGSGLGLSIVRRIADRYSGAVGVANIAEGGQCGLRVTLRMPRLLRQGSP